MDTPSSLSMDPRNGSARTGGIWPIERRPCTACSLTAVSACLVGGSLRRTGGRPRVNGQRQPSIARALSARTCTSTDALGDMLSGRNNLIGRRLRGLGPCASTTNSPPTYDSLLASIIPHD